MFLTFRGTQNPIDVLITNQIMTTTKETNKTKEEEPKGIVIRINPRTVARCISVGLGFAIHVISTLKTVLDESLRENQHDDNNETTPVYDAVPVIEEDDKDKVDDEEEVVDGVAMETNDVDWKEVERSIEEAVESVDWEDVGDSIKKGVESVDWEGVGTTLETWSKSVDWDQVGKSISKAFEQCNDDDKKKEEEA